MNFCRYQWCGNALFDLNILQKAWHCQRQHSYIMKSSISFDDQLWWRHQVETFAALLAFCERNPPVTGGFPSQRPMTRTFDVFFSDLRQNKLLSKLLIWDTVARIMTSLYWSLPCRALRALWRPVIYWGGRKTSLLGPTWGGERTSVLRTSVLRTDMEVDRRTVCSCWLWVITQHWTAHQSRSPSSFWVFAGEETK